MVCCSEIPSSKFESLLSFASKDNNLFLRSLKELHTNNNERIKTDELESIGSSLMAFQILIAVDFAEISLPDPLNVIIL